MRLNLTSAAAITLIAAANAQTPVPQTRASLKDEFRQSLAQAEKGDPVAQLSVADFYREGKIVERDYAEALRWARKAADQNYNLAQYLVAGFYSEGWGVEKNDAEAFKWFLKAAYNGLDMAQESVARYYYLGVSVEPNPVEAYAWLNLAAKTSKKATEHRDNMEEWMTKAQVAEAQQRSRELGAKISR